MDQQIVTVTGIPINIRFPKWKANRTGTIQSDSRQFDDTSRPVFLRNYGHCHNISPTNARLD
ncbi:hypothetical protein SAMN04244581_05022 [Paracoccus denitrificans]|nr:hypothetical protein SAMN04244581_05022 [Paracoccus denitrificans]SFR22857.1 hypothetical protein SAMN04244569_05035 [Paracoccus denitrificans]